MDKLKHKWETKDEIIDEGIDIANSLYRLYLEIKAKNLLPESELKKIEKFVYDFRDFVIYIGGKL